MNKDGSVENRWIQIMNKDGSVKNLYKAAVISTAPYISTQIFVVATNFTKLKIILFFKCKRTKFGPVFKELKNPKICHKALKNMGLGSGIRDPGSRIRKKTYSGSRIRVQGSKRHRIPDPGSGSATLILGFIKSPMHQ